MKTARLAGALLALLAAGACAGGGTPAEQRTARAHDAQGDVVVAVAWPWNVRTGIRFGEGLDMAVAEINAAGGVRGRKLRLRRVDDGGSVNEGLLAAQRLADDPEVMAVIGHLQSYVTVPAAAIYETGGLVMVSPASTDPSLTAKGYRGVFRTIFTDAETGRQMAEYAAARGYRRIAIYYVRNEYGRALANAFEERASGAGVDVVARASYAAGSGADARTFEGTLREWTQMELDAVFLAGEVPVAGRLIAEARRQGITVPILGGDAMSSPALVETGGDAVEGTVVPAPFHPGEPRPEVQRFTQAFRQRYGTDPDAGSALGYDAVHVLARAMAKAPSFAPADVTTALHSLEGWAGVTGPIAFNERGDLVSRKMVKMVVRGGAFHYLSEQQLAQAGH